MVSKEEFREYCRNLMEQGEASKTYKNIKKRKSVMKKAITIESVLGLFFTIIGFVIIPSIITIIIGVVSLFSLIMLTIVVASLVYQPKYKTIKNEYSYEVLKYLLNGYKFTYEPDKFIDKAFFLESGFADLLLQDAGITTTQMNKTKSFSFDDNFGTFKIENRNGEKYTGEDLLKIDIPKDDGSPSGIELKICDLHISREEEVKLFNDEEELSFGQKKETVEKDLFDGAFGYVHFPFEFKCRLGINKKVKGTKKIELEDIKFNEKVKVFTDNQLEAVVILTPSLMEKLLSFNQSISNFQLHLAPSGDMYFKMTRNLFAIKVNGTEDMMFDRFYDDVCMILSIVNEIKNNNKLFKM